MRKVVNAIKETLIAEIRGHIDYLNVTTPDEFYKNKDYIYKISGDSWELVYATLDNDSLKAEEFLVERLLDLKEALEEFLYNN